MESAGKVEEIDPFLVQEEVSSGEAILIDVREEEEYEQEHIAEARLSPLSRFEPATLLAEEGKKIIFHCQKGKRSQTAAQKWMEATKASSAYSLRGGLEAWRSAGLPTIVKNP